LKKAEREAHSLICLAGNIGAMAAGMNDHITKPVNPEKMFEMLAKYLG